MYELQEKSKTERPVQQSGRRRSIDSSRGGLVSAEGVPRFLEDSLPPGGASADASPAPSSTVTNKAEPATPEGKSNDACPTAEEERRKEQFRRRSFSAPNFRPSSGWGKFDAHYWPWMSLMATIVKIHFRFVQAPDTPSPAELWIRQVLLGDDISRYFWSSSEKARYEREFVEMVSRQWSFRHLFRSTRPCWPFIASPFVSPVIVRDLSQAHYDMPVFKMSSSAAYHRSSMGGRNPGTSGWRGGGELDENDLRYERWFSHDIARAERKRIEGATTSINVSPVYFARDRAEIRPVYRSRLLRLAATLKAKNPSSPAIPITVRGYASADGSRRHNEQLSLERAEAVATFLRRAGVPQPLTALGKGPVGVPNDVTNRKVELIPDRTFETSYQGNRFFEAGHEFGHAIGLPDEYMAYSPSGPYAGWQPAFDRLARQAGVLPPDRWNGDTTSVMSKGVDILPRHYLTLWEALGHMTQPHITRNQWRIE